MGVNANKYDGSKNFVSCVSFTTNGLGSMVGRVGETHRVGPVCWHPASKAETAAIFLNCKAALPLRVSLEEMGHPQPKTPVTTDNTTAVGLIQKTMIPKKAKSNDMRLNWSKCREAQGQFDLMWRRGRFNKADYHSKIHPTNVYIDKRDGYVVYMPRQ